MSKLFSSALLTNPSCEAEESKLYHKWTGKLWIKTLILKSILEIIIQELKEYISDIGKELLKILSIILESNWYIKILKSSLLE